MMANKDYDDLIRKMTGVAFANRSALNKLHNSMTKNPFSSMTGIADAYLKQSDHLRSLYASLPPINDLLNSPAAKFARMANESISGFTGISDIGRMLERVGKVPEAWTNYLGKIDLPFQTMNEAQLALQSSFTTTSTFSLLAERSIAGLDIAKVGLLLSTVDQILKPFRSDLLDISESYRSLFASFDLEDFSPLKFHPIVSTAPPIEYYNHARLAEVFTLEGPIEDEEQSNLADGLSRGSQSDLRELLMKLDSALLILWDGANEALASDNPDKVRHFITSLRELYTHVLHKLAPDDELQAWGNDPIYFDEKGKPTRKARLLYICREINHPPFADFLSKDIQATISFIGLFQRGTHEIRSQFTQAQLSAIQLRAENFLRFLLEVGLTSTGN